MGKILVISFSKALISHFLHRVKSLPTDSSLLKLPKNDTGSAIALIPRSGRLSFLGIIAESVSPLSMEKNKSRNFYNSDPSKKRQESTQKAQAQFWVKDRLNQSLFVKYITFPC